MIKPKIFFSLVLFGAYEIPSQTVFQNQYNYTLVLLCNKLWEVK
jgi:hypothetical protein